MARRRRETNIFSLSLLDCICCGFGALILFHMIVASRSGRLQKDNSEALQAEVDKRQQEVLEGHERLVEVRNSFREIEQNKAATQGLSTRILETLRQIEVELAIYEAQTVARRAHVDKLKADLKSLEQGAKRLSGGTPSQEVPGRSVRTFRPGSSWLGVPPESRLAPCSSDLRSAFSLSTCARLATVCAS